MYTRWDEFLLYPRNNTPRGSHRKRDFGYESPPRTLGEARGRHIWIWVCCPGWRCTMLVSVPLTPLIIRWGMEMPLQEVMKKLRCVRFGRLGLTMREPSWDTGDRRCVNEIHRWTGIKGQKLRLGVPEMT